MVRPPRVFVSSIGIVVFGYALLRSPRQVMQRLGLSLGLGGAIANFIDRVSTGEVVDSLKIEYWPAFNLADVALTFGIALSSGMPFATAVQPTTAAIMANVLSGPRN